MKSYTLVVLAVALVVSFQNCGSQSASQKVSPSSKVERVIRSTSDLFKIFYNPNLVGRDADLPALEVDISTGEMQLEGSSLCNLDVTRLERLREILGSGSVCQSAPPAGAAVCMAIGVEDIVLSGSVPGDVVELRPDICYSGVYLCNGDDLSFREILNSLVDNPPVGCK